MSRERSNVLQFPEVSGAYASGCSMPGLTSPELRQRALDNFYSEERRGGADPQTAFDRMTEFARDLELLGLIMGAG